MNLKIIVYYETKTYCQLLTALVNNYDLNIIVLTIK